MEHAPDNRPYRRSQHFIKKGFQLHFSLRFIILIIVEALLLAGFFWYLSQNTLTTSYQAAELRIESTSSFFFPSLLVVVIAVAVVVGIIALVGMIFISHKIAGPLYRFEESLKEIGQGDLTYRFKLRKADQLSELADNLNRFTTEFEKRVMGMKSAADDAGGLIQRLTSRESAEAAAESEALIQELKRKVQSLQSALSFYTTSGGDKRR